MRRRQTIRSIGIPLNFAFFIQQKGAALLQPPVLQRIINLFVGDHRGPLAPHNTARHPRPTYLPTHTGGLTSS